MKPILSPDCRDGNHSKCYGDAWNDDEDRAQQCECTADGCLCKVRNQG